MTFIPRRYKFKKQQKGKLFNFVGKVYTLDKIDSGFVFLKSLSHGSLSSKQIESARQSITKATKKFGVLKINLFPNIPVTKKPLEVRMGKGKGNVDHWVFKLHPGFIICEIETLFTKIAIKALKSAQIRLPLKTKIIFNKIL